MDIPENSLLPFFSYGVFKRGELGYLRFKDLVESVIDHCAISGILHVRDGLPILELSKRRAGGRIYGSLIGFKPRCAGKAYHRILELEPAKQYRWGTIEVDHPSGPANANVLVGISRRSRKQQKFSKPVSRCNVF